MCLRASPSFFDADGNAAQGTEMFACRGHDFETQKGGAAHAPPVSSRRSPHSVWLFRSPDRGEEKQENDNTVRPAALFSRSYPPSSGPTPSPPRPRPRTSHLRQGGGGVKNSLQHHVQLTG